VPADQQGNDHLFQDLFLADNDPAHLPDNPVLHLLEAVDSAPQFHCIELLG